MRCDKGCGDCCGIVPAPPNEYAAVAAYAKKHGIKPKRQGITCPFYQEGTCAVYPVRPTICRVFGHVPDLSCSRGYNTNVDADIVDKMIMNSGDLKESQFLHRILIDVGLATDMDDALQTTPFILRPSKDSI